MYIWKYHNLINDRKFDSPFEYENFNQALESARDQMTHIKEAVPERVHRLEYHIYAKQFNLVYLGSGQVVAQCKIVPVES